MQLEDRLDPIPAEKEGDPRSRNRWFTNPLLVSLALALGISLLANVWLYRWGRAGRADQADEQQSADDDAVLSPPEPGTVRMVFAGDSDIELWEPLPEVAGAQIIRRGVGGDRSRDLLLRLERDVVELKPAVAVMTIGGNDLEDIGLFPDQEEAIVETCERTIRAIVDHLRLRQIRVVLLTIFPFGEADETQGPGWSNATYGALQRVNAMLHTLSGPGVTVVDCDPFLTQANGRRKPPFSNDFEHLNTAGYQAVNAALVPVLEPLAKP